MSDCECIAKCPFFNDKMPNMPLTIKIYKQKYCRDNNSNCARYIIFKALGKEKVPEDLYPTHITRIQEILLKYGRKICECLSNCPFYNDQMSNMPTIAGIYKDKYCNTDNSSCARFLVFKTFGKEKVPHDLFPNQIYRVYELFSQNGQQIFNFRALRR